MTDKLYDDVRGVEAKIKELQKKEAPLPNFGPASFEIDAVLFDMDGTLVNSIAAVEAAWGQVADEIGQDRDYVIKATHGRRASDNLKKFKPFLKEHEIDKEVQKFEQSILDHADAYENKRRSRSNSRTSSQGSTPASSRRGSAVSSRRPSFQQQQAAALFGSFTPLDKSANSSRANLSSSELTRELARAKLTAATDEAETGVESSAVDLEEDEDDLSDLGEDMSVQILPGVRSLIDSLPEGRYAVATSGARTYAYGAMERAGIVPPKITITAEDPRLGNGKPYPDPFVLAARELGYDPKYCMVVEDSPSGIIAGVASGATTLAVCTSHTQDQIERCGAQFLTQNLEAVWVEVLPSGKLKVNIDPSRITSEIKHDATTDVGPNFKPSWARKEDKKEAKAKAEAEKQAAEATA